MPPPCDALVAYCAAAFASPRDGADCAARGSVGVQGPAAGPAVHPPEAAGDVRGAPQPGAALPGHPPRPGGRLGAAPHLHGGLRPGVAGRSGGRMTPTNGNPTLAALLALRADLVSRFPERDAVVDGALCALLAGEHV